MKKFDLLDLRPTQFVLGMKEVHAKVDKIKAMSEKKLAEYCDDHVIPIVLGPQGEVYLIDHHHFARACWELTIKGFKTQIMDDQSKLSESEFWNYLLKKKWTNLYDQFGMGPHSPSSLPADIRCMADDPFRSLAWALIDEGAVEKIKVPFFEFDWAAFLRLNLDLPLQSKSDFKDAIKKGIKLAQSKQASHLPGYKKI